MVEGSVHLVYDAGIYLKRKEYYFINFQYCNMYCSRTFLVYLLLERFASLSYGWFLAIRYKFELSTYIQEPLVIGRRGCV
jgi:hypothetical protein